MSGEIKVTLTLDDAGFSAKTKAANENVGALNAQLKSVSKTAESLEGRMGTLGKNVSASTQILKSLQATANTLASQFDKVVGNLSAFSKNTLDAANSAKSMNGLVDALQATLKKTAEAATAAAAGQEKFNAAEKQTVATTKDTVNALTAAERAWRNVGTATVEVAQKVSLASSLRGNDKAKVLVDEANANAQLIQRKQATYTSLLNAEKQYQRQVEEQKSRAMAIQMQMDQKLRQLGPYGGKNVLADLQRQLDLELGKVKALEQSVSLIGREAAGIQASIGGLNAANKALAEKLALEEKAALTAQQHNESLRAQAGLVKGIAQLWAASKINQGLKASVSSADQYQRVSLRAEGLNLSPAEQADFFKKAWDDSQVLKFASALDMVKARLAAIGGLGENNTKTIDATLEYATKVAHNIQYLKGDNSKDGLENMIRNLYGVTEARQQINDPEAMRRSFDLVQKISLATGGKIDIADLETFFRRDPSAANKMTDEGIAKIVAFLDQAKVSGGHGSGGMGGGVSTVGTMFKMMQAYANGKGLSREAVEEFGSAGLLNLDGVDRSKQGQALFKELKTAGLNVASLSNSDPVEALRVISAAAMKDMTSSEKQRKKYFGDADVDDPEARKNAFNKWAQKTGWSTSAVAMLVQGADPVAQHRADAQTKTIMNSMNGDQMNNKIMDSYGGNVDAFKASLENLKITLGTSVLPMLTQLLTGINDIIAAATRFAQENPLATQFTMLAAGAGAAVLAFKGFQSTFGMVSNLSALLNATVGNTVKVGEAGAKSGGLLATAWSAVKTPILGVADAWKTMGTNILAKSEALTVASKGAVTMGGTFRLLGTTVMQVGGFIAKGFLRMLPLVGQLLLAWDFIQIIAHLEVGGHQIVDWCVKLFNDMVDKAVIGWNKFKNVFASEQGKAANDATIASRQAAMDAREAAWKRAEYDKKRKSGEYNDLDKLPKSDASYDAKDRARWGTKPADPPKKKGANGVGDKLTDGELASLGKGGHRHRGFEDPFEAFLSRATARNQVDDLKLAALMSRSGRGADELYQESMLEFVGKWQGGEFDKGHDPKNRPFKNADGTLDLANEKVQAAIKATAARKLEEEQIKALTFANERLASTEQDAGAAMERLTSGNVSKQTDAMRALTREMARAEERMGSAKDNGAWQGKKAEALFNRSRADLMDYVAGFADKDETGRANLLGTQYERVAAQQDAIINKEKAAYEMRLQQLNQFEREKLNSVTNDPSFKTEADKENERQRIAKEGNEARLLSEKAFNDHLALLMEERARALESPVFAMARSWKDTRQQIEQDEQKWADGFVGMISSAATTGKLELNKFLLGIATDVLNTTLKKSLADPLATLTSGFGNWLQDTLFGGDKKAETPATGSAAALQGPTGNLLGLLGEKAKAGAEGLISFTGKIFGATDATVENALKVASETSSEITAKTALDALTLAAQSAAAALQAMSGNSAGSGVGGLLGNIFGGSDVKGGGLFTMPDGSLGGSSGGFTSGVMSGPAGITKYFANGGIMTQFGDVQLRKYAAGGIANSPQLALYGEGSMNEAYVPLPDGRSIPVTLSGGNGGAGGTPNVTVNVINQSGQPVAAQQGAPRFDGKQLILDVVLTAASQPGQFRDGLKGALRA